MAYAYKWRGPNIVTNGLRLYFDAASPNSYYADENPTIWKDISGNSWNGSIEATYVPESRSFSFNGTDQTISIDSAATFAGQSQVTINVLWKPASLSAGNDKRIFYEETSSDTYTRIGLEQDNTSVQLKWRDDNADPQGSGGTLSSTNFLGAGSTDTFYYISAIYDSINNRQLIYVDGVFNSQSNITTVALGTSTTRGLSLGSAVDWVGYYNECQIACAHIYNRALTADEILQNYNAVKDRYI